MAKRAYGKEDKQVRREDILAAAGRLFASGSGELPAVADIAVAAGIAKGTVYLYFATKEAIFAALIVEGWKGVLDEVDGVFRSDCSRPEKVARFLKRTVAHMATHRELLRLDALGHGVVERNLEHETLHSFKSALTQRLLEIGAVVEAAIELPPSRGVQLLMRTYALTRGLWQSLSAEQERPSGIPGVFQHTNFSHELTEALVEYWRGALADSPSSGRLANNSSAETVPVP